MRAVCSERGAHGGFASPGIDAHEEQVCDVRRGDQKHESNRGEQQPQSAHDRTADDGIAEQRDVHREPGALEKSLAIDVRIFRLHLALELAQVGRRRGDRDAGIEQRDSAMRVIVLRLLHAVEVIANPDIRLRIRQARVRRQHADDLDRAIAVGDSFADDVWIRPEAAAPIAVGQQGDARVAVGVQLVVRREHSSDLRPDPEYRERAHAHVELRHSLGWMPIVARDDHHVGIVEEDVAQRPAVALEVEVLPSRDAVLFARLHFRPQSADVNQAVGVGIGKRTEDDAVEQREDRRGRAQSDAEREDGDQREARRAAERPGGVAGFANDSFDDVHASTPLEDVAHRVNNLRFLGWDTEAPKRVWRAAEPPSRRAAEPPSRRAAEPPNLTATVGYRRQAPKPSLRASLTLSQIMATMAAMTLSDQPPPVSDDRAWRAVVQRDAHFDGVFVYACLLYTSP